MRRFLAWLWDAGWIIACAVFLAWAAWDLAHGRCVSRCP